MSGDRAIFLANKVLRAAEAWTVAYDDLTIDELAIADIRLALYDATINYMQETGRAHVNGPDIDADEQVKPSFKYGEKH